MRFIKLGSFDKKIINIMSNTFTKGVLFLVKLFFFFFHRLSFFFRSLLVFVLNSIESNFVCPFFFYLNSFLKDYNFLYSFISLRFFKFYFFSVLYSNGIMYLFNRRDFYFSCYGFFVGNFFPINISFSNIYLLDSLFFIYVFYLRISFFFFFFHNFSNGINLSSLPPKRLRRTLLRSPHKDKKGREQFSRISYEKLVKLDSSMFPLLNYYLFYLTNDFYGLYYQLDNVICHHFSDDLLF